MATSVRKRSCGGLERFNRIDGNQMKSNDFYSIIPKIWVKSYINSLNTKVAII